MDCSKILLYMIKSDNRSESYGQNRSLRVREQRMNGALLDQLPVSAPSDLWLGMSQTEF